MDPSLLRSVAEKGLSQDRHQLQRFDWLEAALAVFVEEGIDEVRVTRLADDLGVTRGSFYWHFANRDELIDGLVEYWRSKNTSAIVDSVTKAETLSVGVLQLFETCVDPASFDARLDLAVREWARRVPKIRDAIEQADNQRIDAIRNFFNRFGYDETEALIRARVIYFAQIGFHALDLQEPLATRVGYTADYYKAFTGKRLPDNQAAAFARHVRSTYGDAS